MPLPLPDPILADGVVLLRTPEQRDLPSIERGLNDAAVISAFGRSSLPAAEVLELNRSRWRDGTAATFAICDASDHCVGDVFLNLGTAQRATVGYWLLPEARGKGLATRAVTLVSRWALRELGISRLGLLAEPANKHSQRVAERAGYRREGVLRSWGEVGGRRVDYVSFSLLPTDLDDP